MSTDAEVLTWVADRFVHVIGESENVDFVQRLRQIASHIDDCTEAYTNAATERDMYEVAYRDMRRVVKDVLDRPDVPPNIQTRLEAVFMGGEVTPA